MHFVTYCCSVCYRLIDTFLGIRVELTNSEMCLSHDWFTWFSFTKPPHALPYQTNLSSDHTTKLCGLTNTEKFFLTVCNSWRTCAAWPSSTPVLYELHNLSSKQRQALEGPGMSAYSQQRQATVPHGGSHLGLCAEADRRHVQGKRTAMVIVNVKTFCYCWCC